MGKPDTPLLAADVIIELIDRPGRPLVLIERLNPPYGWAIPGGFVDVGEKVEDAAVREMQEEVTLVVKLKCLLGLYSDPSRDPRNHTVTAVYVGEAKGPPRAADDAKQVGIFTLDDLPGLLAFDHGQVLMDYQHYRATGEVTPIRLSVGDS